MAGRVTAEMANPGLGTFYRRALLIGMTDDQSRERRQLAAERLKQAAQTSDPNIRASVLAMAQKWLDRAELSEDEALDKTFRLQAIQTRIGREFRRRLGLPRYLPQRILTLVMKLNDRRGRR